MRTISIFLLSMFCTLAVWAGNGNITGKVTDEKGMPVTSAVINIKGTTTGVVSDFDGLFSIDVAAGNYTVEVRYTGYKPKDVEDVVVTEGKPTTLNVGLERTKNTELNEVTIRSSLKKENINALYTVQKNSATIQDGISADVIRKSPDRSTGEVLKRVSGTTIQDNKFVIVRGLSDRYNTALVDNAILPSTEPNRKAFSFDIIPAALIDNITITKAGTPDLPGDFAGGAINILTKEIPTQNFTTISVGLNANSVSTGSNFKSGYRSSTDFLGFDDGARQLPKGLPSAEALNSRNPTTQESITYLNLLNNDFNVKQHTALPGINLQAITGRAYTGSKGQKFGFTGAITYNHSENIRRDLKRYYENYNYTDNVYIYSSTLGALLNAGYSTAKSKYTFKSLYNRIFDDQFLERTGINIANGTDVRYYAFDLVQKSLMKFSLEGDHRLGKKDSKINWLAAFNNVTNNQPDQRKVSYQRALGSNNDFAADNTTLGKSNNRLFSDLNEQIANVNVNYSSSLALFKQSSFKVGAFGQYRQREFNNRYLGAVLISGSPDEIAVRSLPIEQLYSSSLINNGYYNIADQTVSGDKYNANVVTTAGYAMMDNKISDKVRIVWGARVENYGIKLKAGGTQVVDQSWTDLLPSAHFTYSLTQKSNIRASYFRSVIRPELREMAQGLSYYDYELNANVNGNYALQRSQVNNVDLRFETYPGVGEIFSASVFYKQFKNPIENFLYGTNSAYDITPSNSPKAMNLGAEVELRKNLEFIAPSTFMKNFNFYVNLAYIYSRLEYAQSRTIVGNEEKSRQMAGQSPYVINTSIGYTTRDSKLSLNVLYNRVGDRIAFVGDDRFGHVYESARNLMDFQATWNVNKRSELRLNVRDIFSAPVRLYFDQSYNKKYEQVDFSSTTINPSKDYVYQEYRPGSFFTLSYIYKF